MKTYLNKCRKPAGSALILVVVVTVLLAVVGVMFMMVSRAAEMETAAVIQAKDLENAVDTVVAKINEVLVEDLFDASDDFVSNAYNSTTNTPWLADLEPVLYDPDNNIYVWPRITDLYGNNFGIPPIVSLFDPQSRESDISNIDIDERNGSISELRVDAADTLVKIIRPKDRTYAVDSTAPDVWATEYAGARADADGDGVADSRWVQVPSLTTSRGEPVFAAVRIIDNCAMLNLNVASNFYANAGGPWETDAWKYTETGNQYNPTGRYLSEMNYRFFLRGLDRDIANVKAIDRAKDPAPMLYTPKAFHDALVMNIENPPVGLTPFDISDELEIRNRYLLTGLPQARFENEDVAYETFDWERGEFASSGKVALKSKRIPWEKSADLYTWHHRLDPDHSHSFDSGVSKTFTGDGNHDYYDRRHLCTFYSFDRDLPKGDYPQLDADIEAFAVTYWAVNRYASAAEYKEHLWERLGPVFTPKGTATTNIETPLGVDYGGNPAPYNNVETRRKILHLLYAFRAYYMQPSQGLTKQEAAKKSAQIVANLIDFSDGNFDASGVSNPTGPVGDHPRDFGPFSDAAFDIADNSFPLNSYTIDYRQQESLDCTFITEDIIDAMILEVSHYVLDGDVVDPADFDFGLGSEVVFGYERQPFITEVYAEWDGTQASSLLSFAVELVNPYPYPIDLTGYSLKIASQASTYPLDGQQVPAYNLVNGLGRLVIRRGSVSSTGKNVSFFDVASLPTVLTQGDDNTISLLKTNPSDTGPVELVVDQVLDSDFDDPSIPDGTIFQDATAGGPGFWSAVRADSQWKFTQPIYTIIENPTTIGNPKPSDPNELGFQLACPDDGYPVSRWHDIEILSLFGNPDIAGDPNLVITQQIVDAAEDERHYDLDPNSPVYTANLTDYISPMNRPDKGSLPGRININTAPVHVIAAAIPPSLARPSATGFTALDYAQAIVDNRPYTNIGDLLLITDVSGQPDLEWYAENSDVGQPSIQGDIEEKHWILSHLANKFTVRSDVFTAYILVRLGADGPQRRMIGIFDRSQVWDRNDRPKLVALHPVPDPR